MDYKIVVEETYPELETEVKKFLEKGWRLQGRVSHYMRGNQYWFCQAMNKKDKSNKGDLNEI